MGNNFVENGLFSQNIVYCTALYLAAQNGHKDIVKYISELPIDTVDRGLSEFTKIFLAAQNGKFEDVKTTIESMFTENEDDYDEEMIVEEGNEKAEIDVQSCHTIHEAAQFGSENLIKSFIETGISVNAENDHGFTALHVAAKNGNVKCVEVLIREGATVNNKVEREDSLGCGKTALHLACDNYHISSVSKLLSYGADPDAKDWLGNVPLYYAIGSKRTMQILLNKGANINALNNQDHLIIAAVEDEDIIKMLLKNGLNYKHINEEGCSILHSATFIDNDTLVNFLLKNKMRINIEQKNNDGYSPLLYAVNDYSYEVIKVLLKYGANIHSITDDGMNALHISALEGSTEAMKLLLKNGAYINSTITTTKETALICAVKENHIDIIKLLLSYDADVKMKDLKNKSALVYAIENKNKEVILMLRKCYS